MPVNFLGYTWLNLTNLLINLLGLSWLNLSLFLCEGNCFKHSIKKYFLKKLGETEAQISIDMSKACVLYFLSKFYFSLNDSPSETMKNVFCFI